MRIIFLLSAIVFSIPSLLSQCVMVPVTLNERSDESEVVAEVTVLNKTSHWNKEKTLIFSDQHLVLSRVLKGNKLINGKPSISLVTLGGVVGLSALKADPELNLEPGDKGVVFAKRNADGEWIPVAGQQGFIYYQIINSSASDVYNTYNRISDLIIELETLCKEGIVNYKPMTFSSGGKRAGASISSISPTSLNSGIDAVLTINGTGFGTSRDTSSVQFPNADFGGSVYIKALKNDYLLWSDTEIKLKVRTNAGTGRVKVVLTSTDASTSLDTLKINFAHLNVVTADTIGRGSKLISLNTANGISWVMSKSFYDSTAARYAFIRSVERWRCGSYINWDSSGRNNKNTIVKDSINLASWDVAGLMGTGTLAQCLSYYSGCFVGPDINWFVAEMDIRFRMKPTAGTNWYYGTGTPTSTQFHFESVATHELGHGHQLGHVIDASKVMHFNIANGQKKETLSSGDKLGGDHVVSKSQFAVCGKTIHLPLNSGNCALTAPLSRFTVSNSLPCIYGLVTCRDSSEGNITAYNWDFGISAVPATANTKGPHQVYYTDPGPKTVTLVITTLAGNTQSIETVTVGADSAAFADFDFTAGGKNFVQFTNKSRNGIDFKWHFGDGDSSVLSDPSHTYSSDGSKSVSLKATNTCNSHTIVKSIQFITNDFTVGQDSACLNQEVVYTDNSSVFSGSHNWNFGPGATPSTFNGIGPVKVKYNSPGLKNTTLTTSVNSGPTQVYAQTGIVYITTESTPTAGFSYVYKDSQRVEFTNTSTGNGNAYKWYFGDGDSSALMSPLHEYTFADNQVVRLVASNPCGTNDTTITLRAFSGLPSILTNSFRVYPNPVSGFLNIISYQEENYNLEVFTLLGKSISEEKGISGAHRISTEDWTPGIYIIQLNNAQVHKHFRIVVN